jgi:UDP-N-acetylglucosamine--N-acetylmuramyl-(pentapeptide) pyrophosphoryl-undecaprenol N-acetylglucosamine transferase
MTDPPELRVLLAGGGSGGSATPVLAVAQELRRLVPSTRFLYVGTHGGPEAALAAAQQFPYVGIATGKLRRYWDLRNLSDPFRVLAGVAQAYRLARRFRPHLAFAAGGFASVPPMLGGRLAGARTLVHQQDVEPGLANRLLMPFTRRITLTLPSSLEHFPRGRSVVTGNPVRREILAADPRRAHEELGLDSRAPLVVVTGGGTGALGLNRLVAGAAPRLVQACQVVHLSGRGRSVPAQVSSSRYRVVEFLVDEMPHLLAAATVVVARAGMATLTELAALAKAAIVIPMPASHQWANAQAFERLGAVEVADQTALTPDVLADRIIGLLEDPDRRDSLGRALAASMPRDAAGRIAEELLRLAPSATLQRSGAA